MTARCCPKCGYSLTSGGDPLTPHELKMLRLISEHVRRHGVSPTYGELAAAMGIKSKSGISRLVQSLEAKHWVSAPHGRRYGIALVFEPPAVGQPAS